MFAFTRRAGRAGIVLVAALALSACGGPTAGTVIAKDYDDADIRHHHTPASCTTRTTGTKTKTTTRSCTPARSWTTTDPEHWELTLRDAEGAEGVQRVSRSTWEAAEVGEFIDTAVTK